LLPPQQREMPFSKRLASPRESKKVFSCTRDITNGRRPGVNDMTNPSTPSNPHVMILLDCIRCYRPSTANSQTWNRARIRHSRLRVLLNDLKRLQLLPYKHMHNMLGVTDITLMAVVVRAQCFQNTHILGATVNTLTPMNNTETARDTS